MKLCIYNLNKRWGEDCKIPSLEERLEKAAMRADFFKGFAGSSPHVLLIKPECWRDAAFQFARSSVSCRK